MAAGRAAAPALLVLLAAAAVASPPPPTGKAAQNYILNCMGCHGAEGGGIPGRIPAFAQSIGLFMRSSEGRAYLMHVPGASNSVLTDAELADVLNWLLIRFGGDQLPANVDWYTEEDLHRGRRPALTAVREVRREIVARLAEQGPAPKPEY